MLFDISNKGLKMGNKAVERSLDMIEYMARSGECSLADISKALGIPKASCFDIIQSLRERNVIELTDSRAKTYKLSFWLYQVGCSVINDMDMGRLAHDIIKSLSEATGETCYFAVERDFQVVYIDKVESLDPIRSTCQIGSVNSMYSTGLGKAMLAKFSKERLSMFLSKTKLEKKTDNTIVDKALLLTNLEEIKKRGFAIDDREGMDYVKCVAVPVLGRNSELVGAISVASLSDRMTSERLEEISILVVDAALAMSRKLGFLGDTLF